MTAQIGVHSEAGKLRTLLVCRPGQAHERLTPANCENLLFDDVFWVQQAKADHHDFCTKMSDRGNEVLEMHDLLTETMANTPARKWLLNRRLIERHVGVGTAAELRGWMRQCFTTIRTIIRAFHHIASRFVSERGYGTGNNDP